MTRVGKTIGIVVAAGLAAWALWSWGAWGLSVHDAATPRPVWLSALSFAAYMFGGSGGFAVIIFAVFFAVRVWRRPA